MNESVIKKKLANKKRPAFALWNDMFCDRSECVNLVEDIDEAVGLDFETSLSLVVPKIVLAG